MGSQQTSRKIRPLGRIEPHLLAELDTLVEHALFDSRNARCLLGREDLIITTADDLVRPRRPLVVCPDVLELAVLRCNRHRRVAQRQTEPKVALPQRLLGLLLCGDIPDGAVSVQGLARGIPGLGEVIRYPAVITTRVPEPVVNSYRTGLPQASQGRPHSRQVVWVDPLHRPLGALRGHLLGRPAHHPFEGWADVLVATSLEVEPVDGVERLVEHGAESRFTLAQRLLGPLALRDVAHIDIEAAVPREHEHFVPAAVQR